MIIQSEIPRGICFELSLAALAIVASPAVGQVEKDLANHCLE